jgi:hypothetical protein
MGGALAPLTAAGIAGVDRVDAGAASGVVNAAQQLGVSLGVSVLVTVVAAAGGATSGRLPTIGLALDGSARAELAQAVATALTGSAVLLALGLAVVVVAVRRPSPATTTAPVLEVTR